MNTILPHHVQPGAARRDGPAEPAYRAMALVSRLLPDTEELESPAA